MTTVSYTDFRKNMAYFLSLIEDNCEEIIINRGKGRKAVVLSLDEYNSLLETAYLLSSEKNRKRLSQSIKDHKEGNLIEIEL